MGEGDLFMLKKAPFLCGIAATMLIVYPAWAQPVEVTIADAQAVLGQKAIEVPILVSETDGLGIRSCALDLRYDPDILKLTGCSSENTLSSAWKSEVGLRDTDQDGLADEFETERYGALTAAASVNEIAEPNFKEAAVYAPFPFYKDSNGSVKIGLYGKTNLAENGQLVKLTFDIITTHPVATTISLAKAELNDGMVSSALGNRSTILITPRENQSPFAYDAEVSAAEDTAYELALRADDPEGDPLSFEIVSPPRNGNLSGLNGSEVTYTPEANYFGSDSFNFRADDGRKNSNIARININVAEVNDPPRIIGFSAPASITEQERPRLSVIALDDDGDNIAFVWQPSAGTVIGSLAEVTYQPPDVDSETRITITIEAEDGREGKANKEISFIVTPVVLQHKLTLISEHGRVIKKVGDNQTTAELFLQGTTVTLLPVPEPGFEFKSWLIGDRATAATPLILTMDGNKTVFANFEITKHQLTVNKGSGSGTYDHGTRADISAEQPQPGYSFSKWTGDAENVSDVNSPSTQVTILRDTTIAAEYSLDTYTLDVSIEPTDAALVRKSPDKEIYPYGENVKLTVSPKPGYGFTHWGKDAEGKEDSVTLLMNGNKAVTANLAPLSYSLKATVEPAGSGRVRLTPEKATYHYGEQVTLLAEPETGFEFLRWSKPANSSDKEITITIDGDLDLAAVFGETSKPATGIIPDNGAGASTGADNLPALDKGVPAAGSKPAQPAAPAPAAPLAPAPETKDKAVNITRGLSVLIISQPAVLANQEETKKAQPEADNLRLSALEQQAPLQPPEQEDAYTVDVQPEPLAYEPSQGAVFYPETEPDIPASLQPMLTSPPESMALPSGLATDKPQYAEVIEKKRVAYFWRNYKLEIQGSELPAVFWELGTNSKLPYGLSLNNKEGTLFGFIWGKTRAEIPFIVTLSDESRHEVTGILEVK